MQDARKTVTKKKQSLSSAQRVCFSLLEVFFSALVLEACLQISAGTSSLSVAAVNDKGTHSLTQQGDVLFPLEKGRRFLNDTFKIEI